MKLWECPLGIHVDPGGQQTQMVLDQRFKVMT
ncbi:hypothetical protein NSMM_520025 [Nitrosomonas mobilis]|uniref:Uncharacterized protein n=1 Tax=Nitrosomonas mobilis TaxID=51642 RepID=A0A1G5SGM6_9PROT|nr:hypothetical protein NSMM_520025 [Nitrosomonas mobilis]